MTARKLAALAIAVAFAAGCGVTPTASKHSASPFAVASQAATPTPPAAASPSPTPTPPLPAGNLGFLLPAGGTVTAASAARLNTIGCSGSIGASDPVAAVRLSSGGVLRDYADVAHPRTVCQLGPNPYDVSIVDSQHLLVSGSGFGWLYAVVDIPAVRPHWFELPANAATNDFPQLVAVSAKLDEVVYVSTDVAHNTDRVHVATRAGDQVVATLFNPHGGRCGSPEDSKAGAFSASAASVFVLDQPLPTINSLLVLAGKSTRLLLAPPKNSSVQLGYGWPDGGGPEMALWSPTSDTLYYRQGGDAWKWTAATGPQRFITGARWYYPTISADGRWLAYALVRTDGVTHDTYLVDMRSGSTPKLIGHLRNLPVFLNSTQLWYRSESEGICGPGGNKPLVYDVTTGQESASIVQSVFSVWPSTSSNA